jgi:endonuclease/exonuclease/phosphatase (EEP) superfamily protein YafD
MRWLDRLLGICAAVVVLANLLPLGSRWLWTLELTSHFRVQYLAVTAAMLTLVALRGRWAACAALLAAGSVSAAAVWPYVPALNGATNVALAAPATLKVLTVNVSYRPFSPRRLLELVRQEDPDLLIVQELTPHAEQVLADFDTLFAQHHKFPAAGARGIGVWSRYELESSTTFALGRLPAIEARVLAPQGAFTVIGAHLNSPVSPRRAAARNAELRELAVRSAAIQGPLVVAGDFNITPYSPFYTDWLASSGLTDSRRGRTLSISWPTWLPWAGIPIDHVAVNSGFSIVSHRPLANFDSDHYGVLVELAHRGAPRTAQR